MTAETSNAQGEWVLVPREPSAGMWDSAESAMIESECAYNAGDPAARSDAHGFPTMRIWQAVVGYRAMLAAAPQPPSAPVGVEASYHPCTSILIEGLKRLEGGGDVLAEWDRARAKADTALAQQPAAVNEAAAIRAFEEHFEASSEDPYFEGELELWLTAWRKALAAQRGGRADG